ncbi:MAG: murein L,D-transpeptidase catalytic domain-containing protein [Flavisolibacter sp.]
MKNIANIILLVIAMAGLVLLFGSQKNRTVPFHNNRIISKKPVVASRLPGKLSAKESLAKNFIRKNGYCEDFCFLVDMSLPSGHNRFFVLDLHKDSISNEGLVSHGGCNHYWLEGRKYGNERGCGCSSLGKYRIGYPYLGIFGPAFKLYGLDSSNSNAFQRFIVLHAHDCVPEKEVKTDICQSNGCPMVSPSFLKKISPLIKSSKKPVLLWIFD